MASVGPFPSAFETSMDSLVYFHGRNSPRSSVPLFACCRKRLDTDVTLRLTGTANAIDEEMGSLSLSCRSRRSPGWMFMRVNGSSNSSAENEVGNESEDALQTTLESGKKVLAMLKNLFNQIAERRKLVSAIKSTLFDEEGDGSEVSLDIASSRQNDINDASTVQATAADVHDNSPTAINKRFAEGANGSGKDLLSRDTSLIDKSFEISDYSDREILDRNNKASVRSSVTSGLRTMSDVDLESSRTNSLDKNSDIQFRDIKKNTVPSDSPPSISTYSGTLQLKNEKVGDIKESSPVKKQFADKDPTNKDVKPPPLAGANVLNIILVALECAPWIKTGGLGDVAGTLPKALARRGHRVMAVVPRYGNYSEPQDTGVRKMYKVGGQSYIPAHRKGYLCWKSCGYFEVYGAVLQSCC